MYVYMYVFEQCFLWSLGWVEGMGGEANVFLSPKMFGYKNWERAPFLSQISKEIGKTQLCELIKSTKYIFILLVKERVTLGCLVTDVSLICACSVT